MTANLMDFDYESIENVSFRGYADVSDDLHPGLSA